MILQNSSILKELSPYNACITREQYLFYEMRLTAELKCKNLSNEEIINLIVNNNLFQYPTEKSTRRMALLCLRRLEGLNSTILINAISTESVDIAKQICLYAMMRQYHLVWNFMINVIGEKYRLLDNSFSKLDLNLYFLQLQHQDPWVATWSDATITKLKQVLQKLLVENNYIDNTKATHLNLVMIAPILEEVIRQNHDKIVLPAFNCFT